MLYYENKSLPIEADFRYNDLGFCSYHFHRHVEVVFLIEGTATAIVDSNRFPMEPGDICIVFPHQIHTYEAHGNQTSIVMLFSVDLFQEFLSTIQQRHPLQAVIHDTDGHGLAYAQKLVELKTEPSEYSAAQQHAFALLLLSHILPQLSLKPATDKNDSLLQKLIRFCHDHYRESLTLDIISQKLHVSRYHLSHMLNQKLHMNLNEYLASLRITDACQKLAGEEENISDIAFSCGFNSIRSFNRHFTHITGMSPAQWRKSIQKH